MDDTTRPLNGKSELSLSAIPSVSVFAKYPAQQKKKLENVIISY